MPDEKRRFTRIPFRVRAEMRVDDVLYGPGELENLSIGGCLFPVNADLKTGTPCQVRILLSGSSSELSVDVQGEIVRSEHGSVAVKFTHIDMDSLFHLQNIIRYNSPDPDAIEREILDHPGIV